MHATSFILLALPFFASTAAAAANAMKRGGQCSSGSAQCCKTTKKPRDADQNTITQLAAVGVNVNDLTDLIGLDCTAINVVGGTCSGQTVCCSHSYYGGLIDTGCTVVQL